MSKKILLLFLSQMKLPILRRLSKLMTIAPQVMIMKAFREQKPTT
jgi:hypothetical protein